jgi:hypothetical protein
LARGIRRGTVVLLIVPWAMVGGFVYWIYTSQKSSGGES